MNSMLQLTTASNAWCILQKFLLPAQESAASKPTAPSATAYELEVSKAASTSSSWADAALAGLPPDDEAVQMAELAATAGRSLQVIFSNLFMTFSM